MSNPVDLDRLAASIIRRAVDAHHEPSAMGFAIEAAFASFAERVSSMIGEQGYDAVLARALHLTEAMLSKDAAIVSAVSGTVPGGRWAASAERTGRAAALQRATTQLAQVLGLLCSFIGQDLTIRLVRRTWTDLDDGAFGPASGKLGS